MKFTREKRSSLTHDAIVSFELEGDSNFTLFATPEGIYFSGASPTIEDQKTLRVLAEVIGNAWKEHLKLKPKIEVTSVMP